MCKARGKIKEFRVYNRFIDRIICVKGASEMASTDDEIVTEPVDTLITVSPELVAEVRKTLSRYFKKLSDAIDVEQDKIALKDIKDVENIPPFEPARYAVVDGGSNLLPLNVGNIGFCASVGVVIDKMTIKKKFFSNPEIIPSKVKEVTEFTEERTVRDILDRMREAKVFELASQIVEEHSVDMLIIDGPLIPPGALIPPHASKASENILDRYLYNAFERYRRAILDLFRLVKEKNVSLVGFVKRPHSKILAYCLKTDWNMYDHIMLTKVLSEKQYYPDPPAPYPIVAKGKPNPEYERLIKQLNVKFTYLKTVESAPPFRVDFGPIFEDYKRILAFLVSTTTADGIPFGVLKADEETKMGAELVRELHDDLVHDYINHLVKKGKDVRSVVNILGIYGGLI